jgi:hypothetical protein
MRSTVRAIVIATVLFSFAAGAANAKPGGVPAIPLNAEQEAPGSTSAGSGFFSYTIDGDELCYTLEVRDLAGAPIAAHIHIAPRHVPGPVVVPLATPPAATSTVDECITAVEGGAMTPDELAAIVASPRSYYVNVHTVPFPAGDVRGQLK